MRYPLPVIVIALFALSLVGCGPMTFVVGMSPGDQKLKATIVQEADGWTRNRIAVSDVLTSTKISAPGCRDRTSRAKTASRRSAS